MGSRTLTIRHLQTGYARRDEMLKRKRKSLVRRLARALMRFLERNVERFMA
jgi:hypothetical protein